MAGTLRQAMVFLGLADDGYEAQPAAQRRRAEPEVREQSYTDSVDREPRGAVDGSTALATKPRAESRERYEETDVRRNPERHPQAQREARSTSTAVATRRADTGSSAAPRPVDQEPADVADDYRAPVTPINRAAAQTESDNELRRITTIHPRSYNDAKVIGESFRNNIPVIMNVTDMDVAEAKRLVDFSSGLTFALNGSIERVTEQVFLLTPSNLEVLASEDVSSAANQTDDSLFNHS